MKILPWVWVIALVTIYWAAPGDGLTRREVHQQTIWVSYRFTPNR